MSDAMHARRILISVVEAKDHQVWHMVHIIIDLTAAFMIMITLKKENIPSMINMNLIVINARSKVPNATCLMI
jgi:hypothetical protein